MHRYLTASLLLLLLAFAGLTAACGDDDDSNNTPDVGATVEHAASSVASSVASTASAVTSDETATGSSTSSSSGASVKAIEKDFSISLDPDSVDAGKVTFNISNQGDTKHELVVIKTDLAPDKLPMESDEPEVDEDKLNGIGEKEDIGPGDTATLTLDNLKPGKYVVICNLPGHYKLGMHTGFTVK